MRSVCGSIFGTPCIKDHRGKKNTGKRRHVNQSIVEVSDWSMKVATATAQLSIEIVGERRRRDVVRLYRLSRRWTSRHVRRRRLRPGATWRRDVNPTTPTTAQISHVRLQSHTRVRSSLSGRSLRPTHRHVAQTRRRGAHLYPLRRIPAAHGLVVLRAHSSSGTGIDRTVWHQNVRRGLVRMLGAVPWRQRWRHCQRNLDPPHRQR